MAEPKLIVNTEQAEFWSALAPTWAAIDDYLEATVGSPGRLAMDRLDPQPGRQVLDLGCGTGRTTLELAARVGPLGRAVGADIAPEMLASARQRAAAAAMDDVEFLMADLQVDDLAGRRFDAAYSRLGVMFFADPVAAFANIRRRLQPGGRLTFVCWQPVEANDWMSLPGRAALSVTGAAPVTSEPGQPGPFSLDDPDRIRSIVGGAGFHDVDIEAHNDFVATPADHVRNDAGLAMNLGAVRAQVKDADPATRERIHDAIEAAMLTRSHGGRILLSRGVLVVSAWA